MKKLGLYLIVVFSISGCTTFTMDFRKSFDKYIQKVTHKPSVLIGYQTYELRENIPPLVEIVFRSDQSTLSDRDIDDIEKQLTKRSYYLVEATAGGFSNESQALADKRVHEIIGVLESYGIKSSNIFVAQYKAAKKGRRGYIYGITF